MYMCIGCCHVSTSLQASCVLAVVMHSPESTSRPPTLLHSMHALLTTTVHSQNRSLQASCVLAVVMHSPESTSRPSTLLHSMHALLTTHSKQVTASLMCIGCCHAFTRILQAVCIAAQHACIAYSHCTPSKQVIASLMCVGCCACIN